MFKLEFCPQCGMRLIPTRRGDVVALICKNCGYEKTTVTEAATIPKVIKHTPQEQITVIGEEEAKIRTLPTIRIECPKCENMEAYWWLVQTRGADESTTQFYRCTKCAYTWREMS